MSRHCQSVGEGVVSESILRWEEHSGKTGKQGLFETTWWRNWGNNTGNVFGKGLIVVLKRLDFTANEGLVLLCPHCKETWCLCGMGILPPSWPQYTVSHLINTWHYLFPISSLWSCSFSFHIPQSSEWMEQGSLRWWWKVILITSTFPASSIYEWLWNYILNPHQQSLTRHWHYFFLHYYCNPLQATWLLRPLIPLHPSLPHLLTFLFL